MSIGISFVSLLLGAADSLPGEGGTSWVGTAARETDAAILETDGGDPRGFGGFAGEAAGVEQSDDRGLSSSSGSWKGFCFSLTS
jgi:hypothetical protein